MIEGAIDLHELVLKRHEAKLFKLYERLNPGIAGRGMDLFLTKISVELLNGHIQVESEIGTGTKLWLQFRNRKLALANFIIIFG